MHKIMKPVLSLLFTLTMFFALAGISAAAAETIAPVEVSDAAGLIEAVKNGGSIKLTDDITLTETLEIRKDTTIDGANFTITSSNKKEITIHDKANVTFSNITVLNTNTADGTRCIGTYDGGITLTLSNVTLESNAANGQTLTLGGSSDAADALTVNITGSTIKGGVSGYGILSYVPSNMTLTGSNISGYAALYFKQDSSTSSTGTVVNVTTSTLQGDNSHSGESNSFGAVVFETNGITLNVNSGSKVVSTVSDPGDQPQYLFLMKETTGHKVTVADDATLTCAATNDSKVFSSVSAANTFILPAAYANELAAANQIVAQIAETGAVYATLADAVSAANNQTINLLTDVTTDATIAITKSVTINGNNHTITSSNRKALTIENAANVVFSDLTIVNTNTSDGTRCIGTYDSGITLTLNNVTLDSNAANGQTLTLGGSSSSAITVNITESTIKGGTSGYGIIAYVPSNLTITNSNVSGYGALYFKDGSSKTDANIINSTISSENVHSGESNAFGTIIFETDDIILFADTNSKVIASATGNQPQYALLLKGHTQLFVELQGTITADNYVSNLATENNIVINNAYADALKAEGHHVAYAVNGDVVQVNPHILVHFDAADEIPCQQAGHIEHWACEGCDKYYSDAEGKTELTYEDVFIGTGDHSWVETPAVAPTCTTAGNYKYRTCNYGSCTAIEIEKDGFWDVVSDLSDTVLPATSHTLTKVPAAEATYTAAGNIEYYTCTCGAWFEDVNGTTAITDKSSVVIPKLIQVEDTTANVTTDAVDKAIEDAVSTDSNEVVIELNKDEEHEEVTAVELPATSLETIAATNKELTVSTTEATVTLDTKTLGTIVKESNKTTTPSTVTLEVTKIETETLNDAQKDAIEDMDVAVTISASLIVDNTNIHDFNGGTVTVQLPFTPAEGTSGSDYKIYYIADDGSVEELTTAYENGHLVFTLTHFSEYVVVNTKAAAPAPQPQPEPQPEPETTPSAPSGQDSPATGDLNSPAILMTVMMLAGCMAIALIYTKKRAAR